ncbi:MAG: TldD/PmbA family protein [Lachnospiraceae bacterium]|nr:TldD/PmbA family protein [Lachnospiraceae bacterium]
MTFQEFKEKIICFSKELNIEEYELYYSMSNSTSVETYKDDVKSYSTDSRMGVCYRMILDGKAGLASTENLTEEEALSLVKRALENAKSLETEAPSFIHETGDTYAVISDSREENATGAELVETALKLQKAIYDVDSRVVDGTQSEVASGTDVCAIYNSKGLDLEDRASYAIAYGVAILEDGEEKYDGFEIKDGYLSDFKLDEIARGAVGEAASTIGAASVPTGKYNVVFTGKAFASLLSTFSSMFSAEAAQKGLSLLAGKEGEKIAADMFTLIDDPMYKDCVFKRTFDGEGVATYAKNVIENGNLKTLLHNLSTASKAGVKSTGNGLKGSYASPVGVGPFTFYVKPVDGTREDLFAEAGDGICIKDVSGLHAGANPLSGDFSLLASGHRFEAGKKTTPVKNITVSGNFYQLMKDICRIGADLEFNGISRKCGAPSILVKDMSIAGE